MAAGRPLHCGFASITRAPLSFALQSKGECIAMIAREWKCRVPEARSEGFTGYLYETGIKDSSATPGFLGAQIFRRSLAAKIELTLITYWDSLESIKAFAGNDISRSEEHTSELQSRPHLVCR